MSTELVTIENITPALVFVPNGLDPLLERIEKEARSELRDVSTAQGRENIRSLAAKIAKSKTALDKMGKELGAEYREKVAAINAERGKAVDRLQALQDEIRKPLTEFENKEANRVAEHEANILAIEALRVFEFKPTIEQVQERLDALTRLDNKDWQEFKDRADRIKSNTVLMLTSNLDDLKKHKAEQEKLQKEREKRIAAEAAAKAKADAEHEAQVAATALALRVEQEKAEAERQAKLAEQARLDIVRQKEVVEAALKKAEADKKVAAEKAALDAVLAAALAETAKTQAAEAAAQRERDIQKAKEDSERRATEQREADKTHRQKINNEALSALVKAGVTEETGKLIVVAVAKGEIPHISIRY